MDSDKIEHSYKKYKQYSKTIFRELKQQMENKNPNVALIAKLNGDLEKCVMVMKIYLSKLNE